MLFDWIWMLRWGQTVMRLWWIRFCLKFLCATRKWPQGQFQATSCCHQHVFFTQEWVSWQCQEWGAKLPGLQHFLISMLVFKVVILYEIVCVSATTCFGSTKKNCRLYRLSSNLPFSLCSKRPLTSPFANGKRKMCRWAWNSLERRGVAFPNLGPFWQAFNIRGIYQEMRRNIAIASMQMKILCIWRLKTSITRIFPKDKLYPSLSIFTLYLLGISWYFNGFMEVPNFILLFCFCLTQARREPGSRSRHGRFRWIRVFGRIGVRGDVRWSLECVWKRRKKRVKWSSFQFGNQEKAVFEIKMVAAVGLF